MASGGKREIKTTLSLDGEAEFKRALSDASSALKQLNAEEKLAKAQFDQTGNAQEYQAEKTRILKQKIEEQRKVVEKGEKALKAMRDRGIEPSNRAYQTLSTRVINARTRLVTMNTELDRTQSELTETSTAIDSAADNMGTFATSLRTIGQGVTFQSTITAIDNISSHLEGVIRTAGRAVKAVIDMEVDAGKWADTLMTDASKYRIDVETLQRWRYAERFIDTSVDNIVSSMDKIGKNVDANTGEATQKFNTMANEIGLNYKDESNQVYTNAELFWRAIDALHNRYSRGLLNDAQLEEYSQEFFGRGFRDLLPLIEKGSGAWQEYADSAQVMSTAQVEAMGAFDDARQELEASLDITKYELLASLAPTFTEVAQSLASVVQSFNEFLTTEEGQQMLQSLSDAVSGLVKSFTTDNFNSLVETAATWMERLTDALNWLADPANEGKINGALTTIGASLAGLHISKDVLTALMFFKVGKAALFGGGGAKVLGANAANAANAGANASAGADVANNATNGGLMYWINRGLNRVFGDPSAFLSSTGTTIAPLSLLMPDYEDIWHDPDEYVRRSWEEHQELLQTFRDEEAAREAEERAAALRARRYSHYSDKAGEIADDLFNEMLSYDTPIRVLDELTRWGRSITPGQFGTFTKMFSGTGNTAYYDQFSSIFGGDFFERYGLGGGPEAMRAGFAQMAADLTSRMLHGDNAAARHAAEEATQEVVDIYDNAGRKAAHAAGRAVVEAATGDTGGTASTVNVSDAAMATQVLNTLTRWGRSINQDQFDNFANNVFSGTGNTAYYDQFSGIFGSDFFERYGLGGGPGAMQSGFAQMAADIQSAMSGVGSDAATGLKDGIEAGVPDATTAGADIANGAVEGATTALDAHSPSRVMFDLGQNAAIGLANGIDAQLATVQAAAQRLANIVRDVVTTSLMIHSPSQVMAGLGAFTAEGFAEGISASVWRVEDAMDRMIGATQRVPVYRGAGASGGAAEGGDIHAYIVMDKEIVGELVAPTVDGVIGATISARR